MPLSASFPEWSPHAPDRAVYASNESGIRQVHAWDIARGERRQVTDEPVGVIDGTPTLDGEACSGPRTRPGRKPGAGSSSPSPAARRTVPSREYLHGGARGQQALGRRRRHQRQSGFGIYVSLDGDPRERSTGHTSRFGSAALARRLSTRRPLGGWGTPLRRALGARRPDPSSFPRARSTHRNDVGEQTRRRIVSRGTRLVAVPGDQQLLSSTSVPVTNGPRSGISRPGAPGSQAGCRGTRLHLRLVAGRPGAPADQQTRGPRQASPLRRAHRRAPRGVRSVGASGWLASDRRAGLASPRAGPLSAAWSTTVAPRCPACARSARRPAVRVLALHEPARPAGPRPQHSPRRLQGAVQPCDVRPRRADMAGRGLPGQSTSRPSSTADSRWRWSTTEA